MSKALELRQERGQVSEAMNKLVADATGPIAGEALSRWKELDDKQKALKTQIDVIEGTEAVDAEMRQFSRPGNPAINPDPTKNNTATTPEARKKAMLASNEYRDAFLSMIKNGDSPEWRTYSAMSTTADGQLIPVGFQRELEIKLKAIGGPRQISKVISTDSGNTLHWPTFDDTANSGSITAENVAYAQTNPNVSEVLLGAYKFASDQVLLSVEVLQDSAFDLQAELTSAFATRMARNTNLKYTKGSGTGEPQGLITNLVANSSPVLALGGNSNSGVSGDNEVNTIGTDDLVSLLAAVDPAYRLAGSYMANQSTWDTFRKLKDKYGRPIWQTDYTVAQPDRVMGKPIIYNQSMDAIAASANSVVFGDFSKFIIRDVLGFTFIRQNELYSASGQIGFVAFLRTDSKVLQPSAFSFLQHRLS